MTDRAERLLALAEDLGLTEKQRLFALALATDPEENQTKAAEAAGFTPASAPARGSQLARNCKVQEYLTAIRSVTIQNEGRRLERKIASREQVLARMSERAFFDAEDFVTLSPEGGFLIDLEKAFKAGKGHMIKELRHDPETGAPVIKWADPDVSLDRLAKFYSVYEDDAAPKTSITIDKLLVNVIGDGRVPDGKSLADIARKMLGAGDVVDAEPA